MGNSPGTAKLNAGTLGGGASGAAIGAVFGPVGALAGFCVGGLAGTGIAAATLNESEREDVGQALDDIREANENYEETATDRALEHFANDTICPMIASGGT
mmetsp:Transcript_19306/g.39244  ORF Transcript_19306/g.39244 Transcript_19306/m.39244 type:complete len:101 (+) Transcript_19306:86-388(+)